MSDSNDRREPAVGEFIPGEAPLGEVLDEGTEDVVPAKTRASKALSSPAARAGMIVLAITVVLVGFIFVRAASKPRDQLSTSAAAAPAPTQDTTFTGTLTPAQQDLLAVSDTMKADRAAETGGSALASAPPGAPEPVRLSSFDQAPTLAPQPGLQPPPVQPAQPPANFSGNNSGYSEREAQRAAALQAAEKQREDTVARIVAAISQADEKRQKRNGMLVLEAAQPSAQTSNGTNTGRPQTIGSTTVIAPDDGAPPAATAVSRVTIIPSDTVVYAATANLVNSDLAMPVRAIVVGGKYDGASVSGKFEKSGDLVVLRFTSVTIDGKRYPANAIALDPETTSAGFASSVDHHYLERYGGLFAATALGKYGEAIANSNQSAIATGSGAIEVSNRPYTTDELLKISAGAMGQEAANALRSGVNRPNTVTVDKDTEMSIWFIEPVTAEGSK